MAGASMLAIECRQSRIDKRLATGYLDEQAATLDAALARIAAVAARGEARSIGLCGNAAELLPELARRGVKPDAGTDQTSAHDPEHGYVPAARSLAHWDAVPASGPACGPAGANGAVRTHARALVEF